MKPLFCSALVLSLAEDIHKKVRFSFFDCFVLFPIVLVVGFFVFVFVFVSLLVCFAFLFSFFRPMLDSFVLEWFAHEQ